jgi:hypothetical protein
MSPDKTLTAALRNGVTIRRDETGAHRLRGVSTLPTPLAEQFADHRDQIRELIRRRWCDGCLRVTERSTVPPNWAPDTRRYCPACCDRLTKHYDANGWPPNLLEAQRCEVGSETPTPCTAVATRMVASDENDQHGDFHACTTCAGNAPEWPWITFETKVAS